MTRTCCVCHEPFSPIAPNQLTCRNPACVSLRARQRRQAFELRRKLRIALAAEVARRPPIVLTPPPPSPPRATVLPDGTTALVIWAGDMIAKTGERGGLLGYVSLHTQPARHGV